MATPRALPGEGAGASPEAFPPTAQLAALGPVLCQYRTQQGSELAGWQQAVRVEARTGVDSDGLDERLLFFDAQGRELKARVVGFERADTFLESLRRAIGTTQAVKATA